MPRYTESVYAPNFFVTGDLSEDIAIPGLSVAKGASAPDLAQFRGTIYQNAFAGTGPTVEQSFFGFHIKHRIKPTSHLHVNIHCAHNIDSGTYTPDSATVKWYIDYTIAKTDGTFGTGTTLSSVVTMGSQYVHTVTTHNDMSITESFEPNTLILGRVYRDPADDTFDYDCFLLGLHVHILVGQMGTFEEEPPYPQFS